MVPLPSSFLGLTREFTSIFSSHSQRGIPLLRFLRFLLLHLLAGIDTLLFHLPPLSLIHQCQLFSLRLCDRERFTWDFLHD